MFDHLTDRDRSVVAILATRTLRLPRMVGTWQGQQSAIASHHQPLAMDLIAGDGEVLAPLEERQGHKYVRRVIYVDVGMLSCPPGLVQLLNCERVEAR